MLQLGDFLAEMAGVINWKKIKKASILQNNSGHAWRPNAERGGRS
jgi:hypothetical protein